MPFEPAVAKFMVELARLAYSPREEAEAGTAALGLREFSFFDQGGTQAFVCGDDTRLILAFRGSQALTGPDADPIDWIRNAGFGPTQGELGASVHSGFHDALEEVWDGIGPIVQASTQGVWLTGHSLGAALATLAAARTLSAGGQVAGLYTFGQPRTGRSGFRDAFDGALRNVTYRVINHIDLVTRIPLLSQGYRHVGRRMYFDERGRFHEDASGWRIALDDLRYRFAHFGSIKAVGAEPHLMAPYQARVDGL